MSDMQATTLICLSDIHWSHRPPTARLDEPDWYAAMDSQLAELAEFWRSVGHPPIAMAGDLFDKWNPPIQLVNFICPKLLQYFGKDTIFAIPGQHDLPFHSMDQIEKSAYWNLVQNEAIRDISSRKLSNGELTLYGFEWNSPEDRIRKPNNGPGQHVVLCHKYAFSNKSQCFQGADLEATYHTHGFDGFDLVHYGDNHIRWSEPGVVNPGTFYTRYKNDIGQACGAYCLRADGTTYEWLVKDTGVITEAKASALDYIVEAEADTEKVLQMLESIKVSGNDPRDYINKLLERSLVSDDVKARIHHIMEIVE